MKLKEFNLDNSKLANPGECTLRVNSKAGLFSFSKEASKLLELDEKTKVTFHQDEESPTDWYVKVTTEKNGFLLRKKDNVAEHAFNCTAIAKSILDSIKPTKTATPHVACGFKISKEPIDIEGEKYWLIITAAPLNPR
jgi:hypothetical protein